MRRLRAVALLLVSVLAVVVPASAVSDYGDPAISRLWSSDAPDRFVCTVSYVFPRIDDYRSWVLSAGHCSHGTLIKRNAAAVVSGVVNWRVVIANHDANLGQTTDLALGTVLDTRDVKRHLWLAEKAPDSGVVYIHGFPTGIERVSIGQVVPESLTDQYTVLVPTDPWGDVARLPIAAVFKDTRLMLVRRGTIEGGSSGSPILDEGGNVVGVLWGAAEQRHGLQGPGTDGHDVVMFTPVERLRALMDAALRKGTPA